MEGLHCFKHCVKHFTHINILLAMDKSYDVFVPHTVGEKGKDKKEKVNVCGCKII